MLSTVQIQFTVVGDMADAVLLIDGEPKDRTVVTRAEAAIVRTRWRDHDDQHAALETARAIRTQLLPHGWPDTVLPLTELRKRLGEIW